MSSNPLRESWVKPVPEVKYLNADNVGRYRLIMRYFYDCHTKLKYWLRPEDVYSTVSSWDVLDDYTLEQCQRDLDVLTEWKNLSSRHDGGRANTIEEYLRKRYRYQMTPYAIEIERMLDSLEKIHGYGGSLEPTLLERIAGYVRAIAASDGSSRPNEALQLWRDLQGAFQNLHENASDYLASLQTARAEEWMLTEQFLLYKDTLTHYLQNFMVGLQKYGSQIEGLLRGTPESAWGPFLTAVVAEELRLPSLDDLPTEDDLLELRREEWAIFRQWFIGTDFEASDVVFLERATKESIGRFVRYAMAIQEKQRVGVSRRRELDFLGKWFLSLESSEDAHRLGAAVFGLFKPRHFQGEPPGTTDSADLSMWDELPIERELSSRSRIRRRGGGVEPIRNRSREQQKAREVFFEKKGREDALVQVWLKRGSFSMADLNGLSGEERRLLLGWISRCLLSKSRYFRTPDGYEVRLFAPDGSERAQVCFDDGELDLPNFRLEVKEARRA